MTIHTYVWQYEENQGVGSTTEESKAHKLVEFKVFLWRWDMIALCVNQWPRRAPGLSWFMRNGKKCCCFMFVVIFTADVWVKKIVQRHVIKFQQ